MSILPCQRMSGESTRTDAVPSPCATRPDISMRNTPQAIAQPSGVHHDSCIFSEVPGGNQRNREAT